MSLYCHVHTNISVTIWWHFFFSLVRYIDNKALPVGQEKTGYYLDCSLFYYYFYFYYYYYYFVFKQNNNNIPLCKQFPVLGFMTSLSSKFATWKIAWNIEKVFFNPLVSYSLSLREVTITAQYFLSFTKFAVDKIDVRLGRIQIYHIQF